MMATRMSSDQESGGGLDAPSQQLYLVLAIVLAAGSGLLAYLFGAGLMPGRLGADGIHAALAVALATGKGFSYAFGLQAVPATNVPPLLPMVLAPAVWLAGGQVAGAVHWLHLIAAITTCIFVLAGYGALRILLDLPPPVCLAAIAGLALHPVVARSGGAALPDALAGVLALGTLIMAARAEERIDRRAWAPPGERIMAPVVITAEGPAILGPAGILTPEDGARGKAPADSGGIGSPAADEPAASPRLAGIAVIPRSAPVEARGLVGLAVRLGLDDWWPVVLLGALATLARFEALTAVLAVAAALLTRKRWREAGGLLGLTALLLLPWAAWAIAHWTAFPGIRVEAAGTAIGPFSGPPVSGAGSLPGGGGPTLDNAPAALWQGLGRVLPGLLIPQVFLAGYPLGAEGAPHMARIPDGIIGFWGLLVSLSLIGPLWRLLSASALAARAAGFFALGLLALTLAVAGVDPSAGREFMLRTLLPAAPLLVSAVWLWKAGEHSFERAAAERFKGLIALGWLAAVIAFSPASLGPVREDVVRARAFQAEQATLWKAIRELAGPDDLVASVRPVSVWLGTGRPALEMPLASADFRVAVRKSGAAWLVSETAPAGKRDVVREVLTKAGAAEPDWARLAFTSPGGKFALFRIARP